MGIWRTDLNLVQIDVRNNTDIFPLANIESFHGDIVGSSLGLGILLKMIKKADALLCYQILKGILKFPLPLESCYPKLSLKIHQLS